MTFLDVVVDLVAGINQLDLYVFKRPQHFL